MLRVTVSEDEALNSVSMAAHLLYLMAIPHTDRDGILPGNPRLLKFVVALRDDIPIEDIDGLIEELQTVGLVLPYRENGRSALYLRGFQKNQSIRRDKERPSKFAPPPGYVRDKDGLTPVQGRADDGSKTGNVRGEVKEKLKRSKREVEVKDKDEDEEKLSEPTPFGVVVKAYEQDIGIISYSVSEAIGDAIGDFPLEWITDAITIAATGNKRSWRYVAGILRRCKEEGHPPGASNNNTTIDENKYDIPEDLSDILIG